MKRVLILSLIITSALLFTGCGNSQDANDELPEEATQQDSEEQGVEQIDSELTDILIAVRDIKDAQVHEDTGEVKINLVYFAGIDDIGLEEVNKLAENLAKEKYPDHEISLNYKIEE